MGNLETPATCRTPEARQKQTTQTQHTTDN